MVTGALTYTTAPTPEYPIPICRAYYDYKKTLICIDGNGPRPENQILYAEDQGKVINNERVKHIIVEREIRSEDESQNQTLELVRIELNQKQAAIFLGWVMASRL